MPPITRSSTEVFSISGIKVDMGLPSVTVTFSHLVDGSDIGGPTLHIEGDRFNALFGSSPDATKTRAQDMSDAIYALAISTGLIEGTVS